MVILKFLRVSIYCNSKKYGGFFMLSRFSLILTPIEINIFAFYFSWYELRCLYGGNKIFIYVIRCMSFRCLLKNIKLVLHCYHTLISYIIIGKWWPVLTFCFLFFRWLRHIFGVTILRSDDNPSKVEFALQFKALFIHFLFLSK